MEKMGFIYEIRGDDDKIYIGSTKHSLKKRFNQHKYLYGQYIAGEANYCSSFDVLSQNCKIYELATVPFAELKKYEGLYVRIFKSMGLPVVNRKIPNRQRPEYWQTVKNKYNGRFTCECGRNIIKRFVSRHNKSAYHLKYFLALRNDLVP